MKQEAPFGAWKSPITSKAITASNKSFHSLHIHPCSEDEIFWIEGRPIDDGRNVLCRGKILHFHNGVPDVAEITDVTPTANIRTTVHEYGGASMIIDHDERFVYYSEFKTQRVMKVSLDECKQHGMRAITPITPDGNRYRFADGVKDVLHNRLIFIREDHTDPKNVINEIVSIPTTVDESCSDTLILATGNDFYSNPRLSPDGKKLAYISWNHPNMPWDSTKLYVCDLIDVMAHDRVEMKYSSNHEIVAGKDCDTSVLQPLWHPISGKLFYISDESGYYNVYCEGKILFPTIGNYDFGGCSPGWILGEQSFNFFPDGRIHAIFDKNGHSRLIVANIQSNSPICATNIQEFGTQDNLPMFFENIVTRDDHTLYFFGGTTSSPKGIYKWKLPSQLSQPALSPDTVGISNEATLLLCSSSTSFHNGYISKPTHIEFPTTLGKTAYGYYYPPKNKDYECKTELTPPLLVKAHGGPTDCASTIFNPKIQYWTSRGFAILDVNYGGSTGYGRSYRRRIRNSWGIVDVDDVCSGAQFLVEQKLADPNRLCIDGESAGGYTTLASLTFRNVFTAGCSLYGVADLLALLDDTHKFESRYLDSLIGDYPAQLEVYKERSPITSVNTLNCPILLLQGDEDKIVPPNQAEIMYHALLEKGIPTCLKMYNGEQHGFLKASNIEDALDSELLFFRKVYKIKCDEIEEELKIPLQIENMLCKD